MGSNGVGVKESCESRVPVGLEEVAVGGELDFRPVIVSHIVILREVEDGDVDGGGFLSKALSRPLKLPNGLQWCKLVEGVI